jgi:hypothetical protein
MTADILFTPCTQVPAHGAQDYDNDDLFESKGSCLQELVINGVSDSRSGPNLCDRFAGKNKSNNKKITINSNMLYVPAN